MDWSSRFQPKVGCFKRTVGYLTWMNQVEVFRPAFAGGVGDDMGWWLLVSWLMVYLVGCWHDGLGVIVDFG